MSDAQVWLTQGQAADRLTAEGDIVSRTALLRYLQKHPAIPTQAQGAGKAVFVDYPALKAYREADRTKAQQSRTLFQPVAPAVADETTLRSREARAAREEDEARIKRVQADREEGRVVLKADAILAFQAVAAELIKGFDVQRRAIVHKLRGAADVREAEAIMRRDYETTLRVMVARVLGELVDLAELPEA